MVDPDHGEAPPAQRMLKLYRSSQDPDMGHSIPIDLNPGHEVEIDAALVASGFGLDVVEFQRLMEQQKIAVLCERGTDEDAGLYRASYYYNGDRVRLVLDTDGNLVPDRAD